MTDDSEFQIYILETRKPLLRAAGLWDESYNPLEAYLLWGAVMSDPEVWRLSLLPECFTWDEDPFEDFSDDGDLLPADAPRNKKEHSAAVTVNFYKIFELLGAKGRAELRQRIGRRSRRG
jgi:hypothetical protein